MRWSKLKQSIESNFCTEFKGRLEVFASVYNNTERYGRVWFTFDKKEIANFCDYQSLNEHGAFYNELTTDFFKNHPSPTERTDGQLVERGEFSKKDMFAHLSYYINISVEEAILSPSPIINALGVADKRIGKRRLSKLEYEHPVPKFLLEERRRLQK